MIHEAFSRCVIRLLYAEPFFGHLLAGVIRDFGDQVTTAAVSASRGRATIHVNPRFFLEELADDSERIAVVKHEVLHLLHKHPDASRISARNLHLWNIAADLVVNQLVAPYQLPASAITLATFPDLALAPDGTADAYYERLLALARDPTLAPESAAALARIETWHSDHGPWARSDETAGAAIDELVAGVAARVGGKRIGSLPGRVRGLINECLASRRPAIDWRRVVRIFGQSSRHSRIATTHRRASRRFGTLPGTKVRRASRLAVAIDTSASVAESELGRFFAEVHGIWRQGAEVHVIECDAEIGRVYAYRGEPPRFVVGRGGTRVDPVFAFLRADRMRRWDGCVYLTDGAFDAPAVRPPCPLLWVLTPGGTEIHLRFGRAVKLPA